MSNVTTSASAVTPGSRFVPAVAALVIGLLSGVVCARYVGAAQGHHPADFEFWWRATRLWSAGVNPYAMRPGMAGWPIPERFIYPLPALMVTWPLHRLSLAVASGVFMGISSAWLAWLVARTGLWRLLIFVGPEFIMAVKLGQWSPLLTAAALVPSAGFLFAAKPTLGLACFVLRPTWRALVGGVVIGLASLALWPSWLAEWLASLHGIFAHSPPVTQPLGAVMLLALLKWRRPEARFLVAMACIPQVLFFYDQFPLGLIAHTRRDALILSVCALTAFCLWLVRVLPYDNYVVNAAPYVLAGCYLPALMLVLLRPNSGETPAWAAALSSRIVLAVRDWS